MVCSWSKRSAGRLSNSQSCARTAPLEHHRPVPCGTEIEVAVLGDHLARPELRRELLHGVAAPHIQPFYLRSGAIWYQWIANSRGSLTSARAGASSRLCEPDGAIPLLRSAFYLCRR